MSNSAEVIQGRLGWEGGDVSEASVSELDPHPKNQELYGDTTELDDTFVDSIRQKSVLEPLVITQDKRVISGHRRLRAAQEVGVDSVPVRVSEFDSELAEREALIEFNRQREKTPGQIVNEFEEMLEIEQEKSKERQGERTDLSDETSVSTETEVQRADERAAEKVSEDVSRSSLRRGKTVKDKAESDDEPEEVRQAAQEAWDGLQSGDESFNSAYESVKDAEKETKEDNDSSDIDVFTSNETDEWSSPRELVEPLSDTINGFDLDPCSGAEASPFADDTYTKSDDGLAQSWYGSVWVNPPYSAMSEWTEKAVVESKREGVDTILYLCKGDSSTDWWQEAAASAKYVATIDHRLKFGDGDNSAPFASHIFAFGEVSENIVEELEQFGCVLHPLTDGDSHD